MQYLLELELVGETRWFVTSVEVELFGMARKQKL